MRQNKHIENDELSVAVGIVNASLISFMLYAIIVLAFC